MKSQSSGWSTTLTGMPRARTAAARSDALRSEMLRDGVDTDHELQDLMQVEQAYAANARVVKVVVVPRDAVYTMTPVVGVFS